MYIVKVLENKAFVPYDIAGKFAEKRAAHGAMAMLQRLGESRPMIVELVNPGLQGNKGRTEHGALLEMQKTPKKIGRPLGSKNKPKAFIPPAIPREDVPDHVTLSQEQVAQLVGSIRPAPGKSGEYELNLGQLLVKAG